MDIALEMIQVGLVFSTLPNSAFRNERQLVATMKILTVRKN